MEAAHAAQLDFREARFIGDGTESGGKARVCIGEGTCVAACEGSSSLPHTSSSSPSSADERRGRNSPWTEKAPLERREAVDSRGSLASDLRGRSWSAA